MSRRRKRDYKKKMAEESWPVKVYIYDLSKGMARSLSQAVIGKQIDGVWHTGIVVYGKEFFFGGMGGIESCRPGGTILGQPDQIVDLGNTQIPFEMFKSYLFQLAQSSYRPHDYHLLEHNCNNFSSDVAQFLTGRDIPSYITSLPADVMSTPLGQMIRPLIDQMSVQPSGGHSLFSQQQVPPDGTSKSQSPAQQTENSKQGTVPEATAGNSLPGSANSSRSESSNFDPSADEEEEIYGPFVYFEELPDSQKLRSNIGNKLSAKDFNLLDDIVEYLTCQDKSQWSLGREHVEMVHKVIGDGRMGDSVRVEIYILLQALVLLEDFINLLQHEPTEIILNVIKHYDQLNEEVQMSILKMLTNLTSTQQGQLFIMGGSDDEEDLKFQCCKLCVNCILSENVSIHSTVSTLVYNLCRYEIAEVHQIELGSAILECLQKDLSEQTAFHLFTSLIQLMKNNNEMCDLASVVGMNCGQHEKLSARVKELCSKAREISAL